MNNGFGVRVALCWSRVAESQMKAEHYNDVASDLILYLVSALY